MTADIPHSKYCSKKSMEHGQNIINSDDSQSPPCLHQIRGKSMDDPSVTHSKAGQSSSLPVSLSKICVRIVKIQQTFKGCQDTQPC